MRRTPKGAWLFAGLILAISMVAGPVSLAIIGAGVGDGFFIGFLMAAIPVPFYMIFALWVDRFEPEPPWVLVLTFIWGGAIAVFISLVFNVMNEGMLTVVLDEGSASMLTAVVSAPFIEELTKGVALLLLFVWRRGHFDNVTDGIVYASMVGLGFAMTENIQYYGEAVATGDSPGAVFILRGVMAPFSHPLFTSMTGIGFGLARESRKRWVKVAAPVTGLALAMALHALWNLSASFGEVFLVTYLLVMVPAFLTVIIIALFSLRREARVIRTHLGDLVAEGVVSEDDIKVLASVRGRLGANLRALAHGRLRARQRFHRLATELAFHAWRSTMDPDAAEEAVHLELRKAVTEARAKLGLPPVVEQPDPALVKRLSLERPLPRLVGATSSVALPASSPLK